MYSIKTEVEATGWSDRVIKIVIWIYSYKNDTEIKYRHNYMNGFVRYPNWFEKTILGRTIHSKFKKKHDRMLRKANKIIDRLATNEKNIDQLRKGLL